MLIREHLRYRKQGASITPLWIQESATWKKHTKHLIASFKSSVGLPLDGAQERWGELELSYGRSQKVIRGMRYLLEKKIVLIELDLQEQLDSRKNMLQQQVLILRNSKHCPPIPDRQPELYKDLPSRRIIAASPDYSPLQLIRRYNLALAQGLCLHAKEMVLTIQSISPQAVRYLMRYLKFFGLLVSTKMGKKDALVMTIEGPLTDFGGGKRYRNRMAAVCGAFPFLTSWELMATVELERRSFSLLIDHKDGLHSHYQSFMDYTPPEWRDFSNKLLSKLGSSWELQTCEWPTQNPEQWSCPDWIFKHASGTTIQLFAYQINQYQQFLHDHWHLTPPPNGVIVCFDKRMLKKIDVRDLTNMTAFNAFPNTSAILSIISSWPSSFPK